jgi:hypothetical protein
MSREIVAKCKGCGKPIVWAVTRAGKKIPLDPKPNVYSIREQKPDGTKIVTMENSFYVSHFITCSHVNDFSKGRSKKQDKIIRGILDAILQLSRERDRPEVLTELQKRIEPIMEGK